MIESDRLANLEMANMRLRLTIAEQKTQIANLKRIAVTQQNAIEALRRNSDVERFFK